MITSLQKNTAWMVSATVVYTACQWLTVVFLSKFTNAEVLGRYALALAVVMPVLALTNMQLRYVFCSDAKEEFSYGSYLFLRIATVVLSLAAVCLWSVRQPAEAFLVILCLGIVKGSDAVCDIFHGFLQSHGRMDRIALSLMMQGPLQLIMFASVTAMTGHLVFGIAAAGIVSISICCGFDLRNVRRVGQKRNLGLAEQVATLCQWSKPAWKKIRTLVWLGLPMGLVMGIGSFNGNLPRYFLAYGHGRAAVGIFAALSYLTLPGGIVVSAYCDSAFPQLAKWGADANFRQLGKTLALLLAAAAVLGLIGWFGALWAGKPILRLCYGAQYAAHADSLVWLMAGAGFYYMTTVLGHAVTALREFHLQVPLRVANLLVGYLTCLYLIPREGLLGASKAIFLGYFIFAIVTAILLLLIMRKRIFRLRNAVSTESAFSAEAELGSA